MFLPEPYPECVLSVSGFGEGQIQKLHGKLSIGLVLTTESPSGLKIIPTHEVGFDIDGNCFRVASSMLRGLLPRLVEFCDKADAFNKGKVANG